MYREEGRNVNAMDKNRKLLIYHTYLENVRTLKQTLLHLKGEEMTLTMLFK